MKTILVQAEKKFKISVPDDSVITFGPWSPSKKENPSNYMVNANALAGGTLRVYDSSKNILCCFSNVTSFRDLSIDYSEQVVVEEGSTIWNSDKEGYQREDKRAARQEWVTEAKLIHNGKPKKKKKSKDIVYGEQPL